MPRSVPLRACAVCGASFKPREASHTMCSYACMGRARALQHPTCSLDGCDKLTMARGWCEGHYRRWRRTGSPYGAAERRFGGARFLEANIDYAADGCWNWRNASARDGYGMVKIANKNRRAHRVVYEMLVGPIPDGLTIDHLCRNRACVNPAHLEPVTLSENVKRAVPYRVSPPPPLCADCGKRVSLRKYVRCAACAPAHRRKVAS